MDVRGISWEEYRNPGPPALYAPRALEHKSAVNDEYAAWNDQARSMPMNAMAIDLKQRVKAYNNNGVIVITGLDPAVQKGWIVEAASKSTASTEHESTDSKALRHHAHGTDEDGPNERGTYSKEYTLRHPETTWVHRGQGRYLPESQVTQERKEPLSSSQTSLPSEGRPSRSSARRHISYGSEDEGDDDNNNEAVTVRTHPRPLSPRSTRVADPSISSRRRASQGQTTIEGRDARMSRRSAGSAAQPEDSQAEGNDDGNEERRTYPRTYVDAHPEISFRHVGAGFYRKQDTLSQEDDITAVNGNVQSSRSDERITGHVNGSFDRRTSTAADASTVSSQDNSTNTASTDDSMHADNTGKDSFTKEEMLLYKEEHPNVVFIHRGNGRYRRMADVAADPSHSVSGDAHGSFIYDKAWVDSHPHESYHHCGYGRYKRGPKPQRTSIYSQPDDGDELSSTLVTREYVDQHPELVFHHRGQGRYAIGPKTRVAAAVLPPQITTPVSKDKNETLYDKDYVEAHPDETFHHRGQGRWARGLPPPGSSNKMAVRGPGSSQLARTSTTSSSTADAPAYDEAELPGLNELVRKDEGPEKFPDIQWFYRGGGKWARISKDGAESAERAARAARAKPRQAALGEMVSQSLQAPTLKRKRSQLNSIEDQASDSAQQSGTSTPRPRILTLEEDPLSFNDLLPYERREWSPLGDEEANDQAAVVLQSQYAPLTQAEDHIRIINKFDIAIRPTRNLYMLAEHIQNILKQYQDEYLELDKITAPHARIPRKLATGGRYPVEPQIYEDRKEADLYDYAFDAKRIGFQDPEAQKITRDADGRELRKRRRRGEVDLDASAGDDAPLPRRTIKPVTKFDGIPGSTRRSRLADSSKQGSVTPDRIISPEKSRAAAEMYTAPTTGRWANHIPKRIRELRGGNALRQEDASEDDTEEDDDDDDEEDETELLTTRGTRSRPAASSPAKARGGMDTLEDGSQAFGNLI